MTPAKVRGGETKWLFKQLCDGWLPNDVVYRRKQGFEIPVDDWLRGPLRDTFEESVLSTTSKIAPLVDQQVARKLYSQHLARRSRSGNILWSLLVLGAWANRYLDTPQSKPLETAIAL